MQKKMRDYGWKWRSPCRRCSKEILQLPVEIIFITDTLEDLSIKLLCCSGDIWVRPGLHTACVRVAFCGLEGCEAAFLCLLMLNVWHRFPGRSPSHQSTRGQGGGQACPLATLLQGNPLFSAWPDHSPSLIPNENSSLPTHLHTYTPTHLHTQTHASTPTHTYIHTFHRNSLS